MNLIDHVLKIRLLIHRAFDGKMERLGIEQTQYADRIGLSSIDEQVRARLIDINDTHLHEKGGDFAAAREHTLKQCVFTLFNRLAAIKLMERKELFPEVIRQRAENGGLSAAHQAWLELHPEGRGMERDGLASFISDKFIELAGFIPLYREDYPYSLMPTADELNEVIRAFNDIEDDSDCNEAWQGDDILGWLYENFNSAEKEEFKDSGAKAEYDKVSLQSQVYTPSWVVKFLVDNTLGKAYLEMYPDSRIDQPDINGDRRYIIANRPASRIREPKDLKQIRLLDPACGSGNFLLYAFSLFYDLYLDQVENYGADYNRSEIPAIIVENNLYGVDLDERAVQLAQIALLIKAWETGGRRAPKPKHTGVVCSNFYLPSYDEVKTHFGYDVGFQKYDEIARKIWTDLTEAYKFGSLVRVEEQLNAIAPNEDNYSLFSADRINSLFDERNKMKTQLRNLVLNYGNQNNNPYTLLKMNEAMSFLDVISNSFDVVVANPPYTDSADFGRQLKIFVDANYRQPHRFNTNLYACFIKRCCELAGEEGKVGMIHPMTFMYIKSFEDVREYMINKTHISLFVEYGLSNLFGTVMVDPAFYVLDMEAQSKENSIFISLDQYTRTPEEKFKKSYCLQALVDIANDEQNKHVYSIPQSKLKGIKSCPFIYWISDEFREKFGGKSIDDFFKPASGVATSNNNKYLRFWWELSRIQAERDWKYYAKGGPYNKWYGNLWLMVKWANDGYDLKNDPRAILRNPSYYFKKGITYSASGSKGTSFRILPENCIFDVGGASVFPYDELSNNDLEYLLGLLNSKLSSYIVNCLNPTVNTQVGDIGRIPFWIDSDSAQTIHGIVEQCIEIRKSQCKFSLIEPEYEKTPIITTNDVLSSIKSFYNNENAQVSQILLNEAIINKIVFDVYQLSNHDKQMVLDKEGIPVGNLPVSRKAKEAYQQWLNKSEFKPFSEVLVHLDSLEERDDLSNITDFESLYLSNYDWEEFCIKHKMNPIEVWWQFCNAGILPPQRTQVLVFELITDVIRSLLAKDDDGVIPLTTNAGETNLAPRIEAEMIERGYSPAQIAQVFALLGGGGLERYLSERFFQQLSDHLNLFMYLPKTPFIWHVTSGPHRALDLFVSIYTWSRDTLLRIKSVYAANREAALNDRLQVLMQGDATARAQAAEVRAQIQELAHFCNKIDQLLASGYDPKLDDGVGKNIAPLQKAGIISYEVLNKSQLKKYLNADW